LELKTAARAGQYGLTLRSRGAKGSVLQLTASNRQLRVTDPELFTGDPENTLLIRFEYFFNLYNGFLTGNTFYEIGSGLEQEKEFIYIEVPAGQGNYIWNDYNGDAVKDLNEFESAQFAYEANYIRSYIPGIDYVKTYSNTFSQSLNLVPSKILKPTKTFGKFIVKFTDQVSYKTDRKTTREDEDERFNPFIRSIADSALLSTNNSLRNILFFDKSNPVFGMDFTIQSINTKLLLSNGFESRSDEGQQVGLRWNFIKEYTFLVEARRGSKGTSSDFLSGRNYTIEYYSIKPKITWQPGFNSRFGILGEFTSKTNIDGIERSENSKVGIEVTLNRLEKGSFNGGINYIHILYSGADNNSLAFEMLEGLSPGSNLTWTTGFQRTVAKNLQVNLLYNGRKTQNNVAVHTGGVQVRAFF